MMKRSSLDNSTRVRKRQCSGFFSADPESSHLCTFNSSSSRSSSTIPSGTTTEQPRSSPTTLWESECLTPSERSASTTLSRSESSEASSEREPWLESASSDMSSPIAEPPNPDTSANALQQTEVDNADNSNYTSKTKARETDFPMVQDASNLTAALGSRHSSCESTSTNSNRSISVQEQLPRVGGKNFPIIANGDVVIRMEVGTSRRTFQLQSTRLAENSPWFANSFQQTKPNDECSILYAYNLQNIAGSWQLVHAEVSKDLMCQVKMEHFTTIVSARIREPAIMSAYTQVLGALQGRTLRVTTKDISNALNQAEELVKVATSLACLHLIRRDIASAFPQYRQALYIAIKDSPLRWMLLSLAVQDKLIFTESLVHLVGTYPAFDPKWQPRKYILPTEIGQLIHRKGGELEVRWKEAEHELLFCTIELRNGEPICLSDSTYEEWIIVQIFRDGLVHELNAVQKRSGVLRRGKVFRALFKGTCDFMDYDNVKDACRLIKSSGIGEWALAREALDCLKEYVAEVVKDLVKNELLIDPEAHNIGWLTCVKVEDVPWGR